MRTSLSVILVLLGTTCFLLADTVNVPGDYPTIQEAIDGAVNGDLVQVSPGIYFENIDFKGKFISVMSSKGAGVTVIDGGRAGSVATFMSGETGDSRLEGFTLTNGSGNLFEYPRGLLKRCGGGVFCDGGSPTLSDNILLDNTSYWGGGIFSHDASPLLESSDIRLNTSIAYGAGIFGVDSTICLKENSISGNTADGGGGGVACIACALLITGNTISGNSSARTGGGISMSGCSGEIECNGVTENLADDYGGGIHCDASTVYIKGNMITGNATALLNRSRDVALNITTPAIAMGERVSVSLVPKPALVLGLYTQFGRIEINIAVEEEDTLSEVTDFDSVLREM